MLKTKRELLEDAIWAFGSAFIVDRTVRLTDGIFGVIHSDSGTSAESAELVGSVDFDIAPDPDLAEKQTLLFKIFGDRGRRIKLIAGTSNYKYPNSLHPDDALAAGAVEGYAFQRATNIESLNVATLDHNDWRLGSFICTGSPVSNLKTRQALGYHYIDEGRPVRGLRRYGHQSIKLPFEFELDPDRLLKLSKASEQLYEGERGHPGWNWSIRSRSEYLVPSEGEDFLVVTRIPNLDGGVNRSGEWTDSITMLSGTHGAGTGATRLFLNNILALRALAAKVDAHQFWQALIYAHDIQFVTHPVSKTQRKVAQAIKSQIEFEPIHFSKSAT